MVIAGDPMHTGCSYYHTWLLAATLPAHMHASNSSNRCSQAAALCTQALVSLKGSFLWASYSSLDSRSLTMAGGLTQLKSCQTATITRQNAEWACTLHDERGRLHLSFVCNVCTVHWAVHGSVLFLGIHLGCRWICHTDRTVKVKSSLHRAGWSWLDA